METYSIIFSNAIAFIFFSLAGLLLMLRRRDAQLSASVLVPLILSIAIYALIAFSNILEHSDTTTYLDSIEDIVEIVFLFFCLLFVSNWKSQIYLEIKRKDNLKQKIAMDLSKLVNWEYDVASDLFTFDDQFYALYGTSASEQGGNQMSSAEYAARFLPPQEAALVAQGIKTAMEADDPDFVHQLGHKIIRADGRQRYMNVRYGVVKDKAGRTIKLYGANQDITERKKAEQALLSENTRRRLLMDASHDGIAVFNQEHQVVEANQRFCAMLGYSLDEMLKLHTWDFDATLSEEQVRANFPDLAQANQTFETRHQRKDGSIYDVEISISGTMIEGEPLVVAIVRDVTERKQAEEELHQSQERSRRILYTAMDGFCRTDSQGRILEVNEAYCRMSGYEEQELLAMSVADLEVSETPAEVAARMQVLMKIGEDRFEARHIRKDGSLFDVEVSAQYRPAKEGGECVAFVRDITERKEAEFALRDSHVRLAQVTEFLPDATFAIDIQGKVLMWNRAMEELTGIPAEEMLGQGDYAYSLTFYNQRRPVLLDLVLQPDQEYAGRYANYRREGDRLVSETMLDDFRGRGRSWFWNIASPLRDTDGKIIGAIESIRDITTWRRLEEERAKIESQLRQAQKMEAIGTLAGGIAHDFNNILGAVIGYSEMALEKARHEANPIPTIQGILEAGERARDLIKRILTFSRQEEGELQPLDLNKEVRRAVKLLSGTIPKMIIIETHLAEDLKPILANAIQIEQVLLNLGSNARDAMPQGGRLVLETQNVILDHEFCKRHLEVPPGPYVLLLVSDTGVGMDDPIRERIFDPFFTTKEVGKGTGLGMSTIYGIVKGFGGNISAYSEPGQGSTFRIYLPAYQKGVPLPVESYRPPHDVSGGNETILLVDDEDALRDLGSQTLAMVGYSVITASSGEEALEVYRTKGAAIDLVIMDLGMPGMGGAKAMKAILEANPRAKVMIASGYAASGSAKEALQSGAAGYVAKPFRMSELLTVARQVLDEKD